MCPGFVSVSAGRGCCVSRPVWLQASPDRLKADPLNHMLPNVCAKCAKMTVSLTHSLSLSLYRYFKNFLLYRWVASPSNPSLPTELSQWHAVIIGTSSLCKIHYWLSGFIRGKKKAMDIFIHHPILHRLVLYDRIMCGYWRIMDVKSSNPNDAAWRQGCKIVNSPLGASVCLRGYVLWWNAAV